MLKNAAGEDVFGGGPLFWKRAEPTTTVRSRADHQAAGLQMAIAAAARQPGVIDSFGYFERFAWSDSAPADQTVDHYLAAGFATPANNAYTLPTAAYDTGELAFFRLDGNGVYDIKQVFNPLPEMPAGNFLHLASWGTATPLPCFIASVTPGSPTGRYGLRVFGPDGTVEFDSRNPYPRVVDHLYVSKATVQDILENGTTQDLTLSEPVAAPMIACPLWVQGQWGRNSASDRRIARVRMRQLNTTTIRLDRVGSSNPFHNGTFYFRFTHDAYLTVAHQ